ncbi:DUF3152 domain-containing protein [Streptomyces sp. NPDC003006]
MGRHSRRGPADASDNTSTSGTQGTSGTSGTPPPQQGTGTGTGRRRRAPAGDGTPPHAARGGHPEHREPGGGWGDVSGTGSGPRMGAGYGAPGAPPPVRPQRPGPRQKRPGPRPDYVEARDPYASVTNWSDTDWDDVRGPAQGGKKSAKSVKNTKSTKSAKSKRNKKRGWARALTGVAAAAVTTVLAVVVADQAADGEGESDARPKAAPGGGARDTGDPASRSEERPRPPEARAGAPGAIAVTYEQRIGKRYPLDAKLTASGDFEAIPGFDRAPGKGQLFRYRVDIEKGLGLDGGLFAEAVQKTLNDDRSWAHDGARAFERISSGQPDFVITLASPGTTAAWCAKSGLDTTQDNVSCDSAATDRVMINAYRWAQGAKTYGDAVQKAYGSAIHPYRQMLINHEVGHRLGFNHTDCTKDGDLAPVMQQQTKFLDHDGIRCKANPWAFPEG